MKSNSAKFQSTHPARGATGIVVTKLRLAIISIHAPRERCDMVTPPLYYNLRNFNPRTPREVRPVLGFMLFSSSIDFNPRTPREVRQAA